MKALYAAAGQGGETAKRVLLRAFWHKDTDASRDLLALSRQDWDSAAVQRQAEFLLADRPLPLERRAPTAAVLDLWWAAFFATGDLETVKLIAQQAHLLDNGSGMEIAVGGAASWSLASNAARHPKVRGLLEELAREAEGQRSQSSAFWELVSPGLPSRAITRSPLRG